MVKPTLTARSKTFVYVGSGDWGPGEDGYVSVFSFGRADSSLDIVSRHPAGGLASFLVIDEQRHRLYVADEGEGGVISFAIDTKTGRLRELGRTESGNNPVHLSLTKDGAFLLAANYEQGSVDVFPIDGSGLALPPSCSLATGRQAHCVAVDEKKQIVVANKGSGTLTGLALDGDRLHARTPTTTPLPSARHITHDSDGRLYVISEEADLLSALQPAADGTLQMLWQTSRLPISGNPTRDTGAHIHITPNEHFLYATNRGKSNTIVGFDLRPGARGSSVEERDEKLEPLTPEIIASESTRGETPRHFAIDPCGEFLLVANHGSDKTLTTFSIGEEGELSLRSVLPTSVSPFCVGIVLLEDGT